MLKKLVKISIVLSTFILCIPTIKDISLKTKIDKGIINKNKSIYEGYIYLPKYDYKNLIKKDESALDDNLVLMTNFSDPIGDNNIVLAGHNNKYVFNKLYYMSIGDEIILSDFSLDYKYVVDDFKYISVDDYNELIHDNSLVLITCTNDNQKRYIVIAKRK